MITPRGHFNKRATQRRQTISISPVDKIQNDFKYDLPVSPGLQFRRYSERNIKEEVKESQRIPIQEVTSRSDGSRLLRSGSVFQRREKERRKSLFKHEDESRSEIKSDVQVVDNDGNVGRERKEAWADLEELTRVKVYFEYVLGMHITYSELIRILFRCDVSTHVS